MTTFLLTTMLDLKGFRLLTWLENTSLKIFCIAQLHNFHNGSQLCSNHTLYTAAATPISLVLLPIILPLSGNQATPDRLRSWYMWCSTLTSTLMDLSLSDWLSTAVLVDMVFLWSQLKSLFFLSEILFGFINFFLPGQLGQFVPFVRIVVPWWVIIFHAVLFCFHG